MSDLQKAIDELLDGVENLAFDASSPNTTMRTSDKLAREDAKEVKKHAYDQLKSLLEQVAKEQRDKCYDVGSNFAPLVTDNLTFNEE